MDAQQQKEARRAQLEAELAALDATPAPPPWAEHETEKAPPEAVTTPAQPAWQEPVPGGAPTVAPPSAPADPAAVAAAEHPDETVSESSYDVVASDGSTERNTPGYSHVPCPVCGNTSVKTANVAAALPVATLQGETVNPGDQVVVCESCSTTIAAGDVDRYVGEAKAGAYGDEIKAAAEGGTVDETTTEGGTSGNSETESGSAPQH